MASKYTEEQKLAAVQAYIRGEGGIRQVARTHDVSRGALIQWVAHYKQNGRLPPSSQQQENIPVQTPQNNLPPRSSLQFRLEVLYWQQLHHASDLKTAVTFQLKGMEIVSKWRYNIGNFRTLFLIRSENYQNVACTAVKGGAVFAGSGSKAASGMPGILQ